ncbi:MAG: helix-turn-helix transcriptional regulator [Treponema sp.]|nr:helix-turn-helix transcriptional regulator [Treponema sp.]
MSLEKTVIDNIKRIRKEKGITQEQLAEACNTATSYIGLMEIYRNVPKLSTIERIAAALGVEPQVLLQKPNMDTESEKKIDIIRSNVMRAVEKELTRSLRENMTK